MQKNRILSNFTGSYLTELEDELRNFKRYVPSSTGARTDVKRHVSCFALGDEVFCKALETFKKRFKKIVSFFRGLETVL